MKLFERITVTTYQPETFWTSLLSFFRFAAIAAVLAIAAAVGGVPYFVCATIILVLVLLLS